MAGFNYEAGKSNNMVSAEARGMLTLGRWAKKFGVKATAAAVKAVMQPTEAHHTGTGRVGKSRLSFVLDSAVGPNAEQIARMIDFDAAEPQVFLNCICRETVFGNLSGAYGRIIRRKCVPSEKISRRTVAMLRGKPTFKACSLLIIDESGEIIFDGLNREYDDFDTTVARMKAFAAI